MGNETSPSPAENKNYYKVDSSQNIGNELDKVWETNHWGRSYGNMSTVMENHAMLRVSRILITFPWELASQPTIRADKLELVGHV